MNGRFSAAIVAFAVATAVVTRASMQPEFLVQLHDPNLLGGAIFAAAVHTLGYAFVLSLCAVLSGAAVLLSAWRARTRGASDWHAALAAILVALCLTGRLGVSLDPIGWVCAAAFCLVLDRDDKTSTFNAIAIVAAWSLLQGGAPLGALLAILALGGSIIDARGITPAVRRKAVIAGAAVLIGSLQPFALPWHAYGPHALYLDAYAAGAQRDRIWSSGFSVPALGFSLIAIVAAWYGVRRRALSADALTFFALLILALADGRNLPYFAIACAPIVADALASYYLDARTFPTGSVRQYLVTFAAAAAAFIASLTATEPKATSWPLAPGSPVRLIASRENAPEPHRILCVNPRWCDGVPGALLDDRAGIADARSRRTQSDVVNLRGHWRSELRESGIDAVIAGKDDSVESLLTSTGWRATAHDESRVLLQRGGVQ